MHHEVDEILEATAYDRDGERIGGVSGVYVDDQTAEPMWVSVNTGLFGMSSSFAPLLGATLDDERLTLAVDKASVKDAPNVDEDGHLTRVQEDALYEYYQVDSDEVEDDKMRTRRWDRDVDQALRSDGPLLDRDVEDYPDAGDGPLAEPRRGADPIDHLFDDPDRTNPPRTI